MEKQSVPQCVGFIMDGNRRWAKRKNVPTLLGHLEGYTSLKKIMTAVRHAHIPHMVCYAFSTENWKRDAEEVQYLMQLIERALAELHTTLRTDEQNIRVRIIGEREALPQNLQEKIRDIESEHTQNPTLTVWVALSYGSRAEMVQAVNKAIEKGISVTEESFESLLWTSGMPDPDLIIRTSGEIRLSNFLLWQSVYSELFFTDTLWPDFGESEFQSILEQYAKRQRRKGA